jgi:hypothetical protein
MIHRPFTSAGLALVNEFCSHGLGLTLQRTPDYASRGMDGRAEESAGWTRLCRTMYALTL